MADGVQWPTVLTALGVGAIGFAGGFFSRRADYRDRLADRKIKAIKAFGAVIQANVENPGAAAELQDARRVASLHLSRRTVDLREPLSRETLDRFYELGASEVRATRSGGDAGAAVARD